jgi:hypothetical protein
MPLPLSAHCFGNFRSCSAQKISVFGSVLEMFYACLERGAVRCSHAPVGRPLRASYEINSPTGNTRTSSATRPPANHHDSPPPPRSHRDAATVGKVHDSIRFLDKRWRVDRVTPCAMPKPFRA